MRIQFASITALHRAYSRRSRSGDLTAVLLHAPSSEDPNHSHVPRRWHGGDSHHHHSPPHGAEGIFRLGLAADVFLAAGKSLTGYVSGSTAVIADAAHSLSDIVLSGVAWWSYAAAKAPKDKEHPYGHGKFETLGALGISGMLLVTGGGIAWHAIDVLQGFLTSNPDMINHTLDYGHHNHGIGGHHHRVDLEHPVLALSMTIISISVKEGLYWITKRAGEKEGSGLMKANAWHHRSDAVSSVVALIGVGGAILGVPFLDPLAGLVVSGMIWKAGFETGYQSVMELVDAGVDESVLVPIKQTIDKVEGVKGCHRLRGRRAGSFLYLDVHIEVDPFLSVSAAHDIGEMVRHQIHKYHSQVAEVYIHIDPSYSYSTSDRKKNLKGTDEETSGIVSMQQKAETVVSDTLSTLFSERMSLERITIHSLQGKVLVQVQVTMPSEMSIREAMDIAKDAEQEILKATSSISRIQQVSIQLSLGHPMGQLHEPVANNKENCSQD